MAGNTHRLIGAAAAVLAVACASKSDPKVGEARLVQADGVVAPAEGPNLVVTPQKVDPIPAQAQVVRVAIDREVPFSTVAPLLDQLVEQGKRPVILVKTRTRDLKAMPFEPPSWGTPSINVIVTADGKACVSLPGVEEAKCVKTQSDHVDRSYTRELVREAMKVSNIEHVRVEIAADVQWADVVRAVDGARTCCEGTDMTVGVKRFE